MRQAPLCQRAWVVQEQVLAPRSLYFGESQLFWECRRRHACEVFPGGEEAACWEPRQYESPYEVWNDIMESYARCDLTNPDDKLVAISGVVKGFADAIDDEYAAGLWRNNMANGLL